MALRVLRPCRDVAPGVILIRLLVFMFWFGLFVVVSHALALELLPVHFLRCAQAIQADQRPALRLLNSAGVLVARPS